MKQYLSYKWELWKLYREERKLTKPFDKEWGATKDKNYEKYREIYHHIDLDLEQISESRNILHTKYIMGQMHKLDIPTPPPHSNVFKQNSFSDTFELTQEGRHELRMLIRAEQTRRRQPIYIFITLTTGLIGAATGLVSVILK